MTGSPTSERLSALVEDAASRLDVAAGATAVCTWSRSGVAVPAIKYAEGRWAALRSLERAVRRGGVLAELADAELRTWDAALADLTAKDAGADWVAYRTGGVDALRDLLG
ncbi:MAG: hypothetical protein AB7O74_06845 [Candidatus Nanopelagicales bacterium]